MNKEPHEISEMILNHIKDQTNDEEFDVTNLRMGLGLCLSSIHAAMLYGAKGEEAQHQAVHECMDSIERMIKCLKRDIETIGIEGVAIISEQLNNEETHKH
jgi:hypothetical protein